jgi:hypothetical protein
MRLCGGGPRDTDDGAGHWYTLGSVSVSWKAVLDETRRLEGKRGRTHDIRSFRCYRSRCLGCCWCLRHKSRGNHALYNQHGQTRYHNSACWS